MFAIVQNNQVCQLITDGSGFTWNGVQYPPQWIAQSTPEQRAEIGLVDVVYGPYPNDYFYWVSPNQPVYNAETNQVDITFTSIPKDIVQLKSSMTSQVNQSAYTILLPSDWMVVKAVETSGTVAPDWNTWRQTIRTQAADAVAVIEACTTVDELATLPSIQWTPDPNNAIKPVIEAVEPVVEEPVEVPVEPTVGGEDATV